MRGTFIFRVSCAAIAVVVLMAGASGTPAGGTSVGAAAARHVPAPGPGSFVSLNPSRIVDSRDGRQIQGALAGLGTAAVQVTGLGGVPASGVSAVVLNVTVTGPATEGFLTAYASGTARPASSNLNFTAGQTVPNLVIAPVGTDGKVALHNGGGGSVHVIADVSGYFLAGAVQAPGGFGAVASARVLDTRTGAGTGAAAAVKGGGAVSVTVTGQGGVPASGVSAVVLNVTVTGPSAEGYLTAYASGASVPASSNLNFVAGQTVPNLVIAPVGADGKVALYHGGGGTVHVIADLAGYVLAGDVQVPGGFDPVAPARVLDTRTGAGVAAGAVPADGTVIVKVTGVGGVPSSGVSAVALNVTVTGPAAAGYLTAFASGRARPLASNLNFIAGQTVPNMVIAPVGADGKVAFYNGAPGAVHVVADLSGYTLAGAEPQGTGTVRAWGFGSWGSLGQGQLADSTSPVTVSGLTGVKDIAGGYHVGYALRGDGTVWAWGYGSVGELGNGGTADSAVPVQVSGLSDVTSIAGGQATGYALKRDGTVWAWGYDYRGRLGNGAAGGLTVSTPVRVSTLSGVTAISGGSAGAVALKSDGTVWTWGAGGSGELGNGAAADSAVPVQVSSLTGVVAVAGSVSGSYALRGDGTVWAWGSGFAGRLGNGTAQDSAVPVRVAGLTAVSAIAGGGFSGYALRSDGTIWSWGYGKEGQLGNRGNANSLIPVQVAALTGVTTIAAGYGGGYAVRSDGTVWSWGAGSLGQLGNGKTADSAVPVQVTGLTGVTGIAGGDFAAYALS
jgi:alpha-tubulin suppressor-like RCC1 family protein